MGACVSECVRPSVRRALPCGQDKDYSQLWHCMYLLLGLVGRIQTAVYVQSLSNFTCRLWMMKEETLLILGQGGQGQLWHSVYKTLWA